MSRFWTDTARRLTPYVPGEQRSGDGIVKLNTNENPYPPSNAVMQAIANVPPDALRRYPDPESVALRESLARYHGVELNQVFVGNGSDEVLALAFQAFFKGCGPLQFPDISYSFYPVYCDLYDIESHTIALATDFVLNLDGFSLKPGGIVFPNPNAPTARAVSAEAIRALLQRHADQVVLVDEAYADFGAESVINLIDEFPNLLVSRTFSKGRSLAGLRLGAAFGQADLIEGLLRVKNSFNSYPVDAVAQAAGIASLLDEPTYRRHCAAIIETRQRMSDALSERGFKVLPSAANFVFASPGSESAGALHARLSQANVLVRYWSKPAIADWLRISVGTDADLQRLLDVIDEPAVS